jgi:hypothetical protein
MKKKRQIGFLVAILAGLIVGLAYGWILNPAKPRNVTLDSLRSDYQADYVLMVAENFAVDRDLAAATASLQKLSDSNPPLVTAKQALIMGQQLGYSDAEQQIILDLETALSDATQIPTEEATP